MQKFRQFIAIIVLHTILFSLGTSSLNAVEEEIYSLDHLPFAEISDTVQDTLVPAPYQATEDDRRDMLDGDSFLQSKTESEQPMQIHFVYSGSEEVRTLLAEKRIFDTKGFSEEDPSRVFFQVPDFFLQPQMAWSNFFLSGSFGNSVAPLSDRWGDWMGGWRTLNRWITYWAGPTIYRKELSTREKSKKDNKTSKSEKPNPFRNSIRDRSTYRKWRDYRYGKYWFYGYATWSKPQSKEKTRTKTQSPLSGNKRIIPNFTPMIRIWNPMSSSYFLETSKDPTRNTRSYRWKYIWFTHHAFWR